MKRDTLIWKIVNRLHDERALELDNYMNYIEQANDIYKIIERELKDFTLIQGEVME
ncbi:hypothetical protein [Cellulosilyticum lentocellum]|uniref:Uncharacterized protein n=1 Tax=Cellulosilyticum lentocellum (strain ATCC 49066 / DSM 5427 / NCIMB 11756 / RHM5) TaxID=642492 RepID=F2JQ49_CELLD|nr:hypothetical protein [Cellulosilyticum lentocellum]ADZ82597.1 hypothetical protein Clole_0864 [Cellulosilyticum lentocellum DSM 5427]